MLKLRIASDLHLDSYPTEDERVRLLRDIFTKGPCYDAAVVPGDLSNFRGWHCTWDHAMSLLLDIVPRDIPILFVPGNHDFSYASHPSELQESLARITRGNFFDLVEKDGYVNGVRFVGATNWYKDPGPGHPLEELKSTWYDYRTIPRFEHLLQDWHSADQFDLDRTNRGDIVVTHMLPDLRLVAPAYKDSPYNHFFVNPTPQTLTRARAHIFGHTHTPTDTYLPNTVARCICRPSGYSTEEGVSPRDWTSHHVDVA